MRFDSRYCAVVLAGAVLATTGSVSAQFFRQVDDIELIGQASLPTGTMFQGTEVGGLSGLAYDADEDRYYALSDDRSQLAPARFYTLSLDVVAGAIQVQLLDVTTLTEEGNEYESGGIDPEGIALFRNGDLFVCSEGDANALLDPFVNRFRPNGELRRELPVPSDYSPTAGMTSGIRNNLAFESLTLSPNQWYLYTATENALVQDGPAASLTEGSPCRILQYSSFFGLPLAESFYETDPIPDPPVPAGSFATNGLVELLATDNLGGMLALERAFSVGVGNSVRLYEVRVRPWWWPFGSNTVNKSLVLDLDTLGFTLDNLEAMAFGPRLPDGRELLYIVSDNNFNATQFTQFLAFAVKFR